MAHARRFHKRPRLLRWVVIEVWVAQPGACVVCRALDGTLFRANEGPRPPLHPHCRCYRRAVRRDLLDEDGNRVGVSLP
ncbi:MAG TPA: hypothetical protein VFI42_10810 [Thermomicrobiaceae bacterium]|nr:hypothetical protein [Thermomicrobiaceae bacterium]